MSHASRERGEKIRINNNASVPFLQRNRSESDSTNQKCTGHKFASWFQNQDPNAIQLGERRGLIVIDYATPFPFQVLPPPSPPTTFLAPSSVRRSPDTLCNSTRASRWIQRVQRSRSHSPDPSKQACYLMLRQAIAHKRDRWSKTETSALKMLDTADLVTSTQIRIPLENAGTIRA